MAISRSRSRSRSQIDWLFRSFAINNIGACPCGWFCQIRLEPLLAGVIDFFQDAPLLRLAVAAGRARGAAPPGFRIAKDPIVLDVKLVLVVVLVEVIPAGLSVVANVLVVVAVGEAVEIALGKLDTVLGRVG